MVLLKQHLKTSTCEFNSLLNSCKKELTSGNCDATNTCLKEITTQSKNVSERQKKNSEGMAPNTFNFLYHPRERLNE